jgi:hypothetical protein
MAKYDILAKPKTEAQLKKEALVKTLFNGAIVVMLSALLIKRIVR